MSTPRKKEKPPFEPGLIPAPGTLLDWRDSQHFDHWQDRPCALCEQPTPTRSHSGEPVHKVCAEGWITAHPVKAREGRFTSDAKPRRGKTTAHDDHA